MTTTHAVCENDHPLSTGESRCSQCGGRIKMQWMDLGSDYDRTKWDHYAPIKLAGPGPRETPDFIPWSVVAMLPMYGWWLAVLLEQVRSDATWWVVVKCALWFVGVVVSIRIFVRERRRLKASWAERLTQESTPAQTTAP